MPECQGLPVWAAPPGEVVATGCLGEERRGPQEGGWQGAAASQGQWALTGALRASHPTGGSEALPGPLLLPLHAQAPLPASLWIPRKKRRVTTAAPTGWRGPTAAQSARGLAAAQSSRDDRPLPQMPREVALPTPWPRSSQALPPGSASKSADSEAERGRSAVLRPGTQSKLHLLPIVQDKASQPSASTPQFPKRTASRVPGQASRAEGKGSQGPPSLPQKRRPLQ